MTRRRILALTLLALAVAGATLATPVTATAAPSVVAPATTAAADGPGAGRVELLLDSSGSMKEPASGGVSKIEAAKKALRTVVAQLPEDAAVGLRVFGATVFSRTSPGACTDTQQVVAPGTGNRARLLRAVAGYRPFGETPIPAALRQAARDLGSTGTRTVVLVSDGESTCPPSPCTVAGELARTGIDLHVDVVGLSVSGAAREQLRCIAAAGNGSYYDAGSAAEIESRLVRVAQRAARPFSVDGTRVRGGTQADPTALRAGDSQDVLPPGRPLYYAYTRRTAGTTLRLSAYLQETQGNRFLQLELLDPSGTRCQVQSTGRSYDSRNVLGAQVTAGPDGACGQPGTYLLKVSRSSYAAGATPLPVGLRVSEEPRITDPVAVATAPATAAAPQVNGTARAVVAGASFAGAPLLGTGVYRSTAVAGEVGLYRVHLGYGQALRVSTTFAAATPAQQRVVGRFSGPLADLALDSPTSARLAEPPGSRFSGAVGVSPTGAAPVTLTSATPVVSARARAATGQFGAGGDTGASGDYVVAVSLQQRDYTVEFPYTLRVQVVGDEQPGPTYADGARWSLQGGPSPTASPSAAAAPSRRAAPTRDGGPPTGLLAGGLAVLLAAVAAGALVLRRRRR